MTSLLSVIRLDLAASCCSVGVSLICNQHLLYLGKVLSLSFSVSDSLLVCVMFANLCMIYAIFMFQALTNNECSNHSFGSLGSSSDKESEVCAVTFLNNIHNFNVETCWYFQLLLVRIDLYISSRLVKFNLCLGRSCIFISSWRAIIWCVFVFAFL